MSTFFFSIVTGPDTTDPIISNCPSDITQTVANLGDTATVTWTPPTATDDVTPVNAISEFSNFQPGATFVVGTTTVAYVFTDASNNQAVCTFTVTLQGKNNSI